MGDELQFADESAPAPDGAAARAAPPPWVVLVADDEPAVHEITELVLAGFRFDGRPIRLLRACSAAEARSILAARDDIALALLDVVMETEHAGLELARWVREQLGNVYTRIVLRTGQPGAAPEEQVIRDYDINDYKDKTELTRTRLTTLLYSALRSYRDICTIRANLKGMERVIGAISQVSESRSIQVFASAVLEQITILLGLGPDAVLLRGVSAWAVSHSGEGSQVLAATGAMAGLLDPAQQDRVPAGVRAALREAMAQASSLHGPDHYVGFYRTARGSQNLLYVGHAGRLGPLERKLLEIYSANVAITYESLLLKEEVEATQRELVFILGEAVERRSRETGAHVRRVGLIAHHLALACGVAPEEAELIKLAAPLHDTGKIGIPDHILNKPGRLDAGEWEIMKTHADIGHELLSQSTRRIPRMAAVIAREHHEKWDGSGYPLGLAGERIHVAGRVTAVADVLDALLGRRSYKEPWAPERVLEHFRAERGRHFDPRLVDLLVADFAHLLAIRAQHPDPDG